MNDEDIKILEILKETLIKDKFIIPKEPKKWCEAIENLINRNKELEEIEQSHKEENGKLRVELEQEKEKNNELEIELSTRDNINVDKLVEKYKYYRRLADSYQANCISKDKIKEKIEELEKRYTEHCYFQYNKKEVLDICINELKELLEE